MVNVSRERRDLAVSLLILAFVIVFALIGLAFDGNWPKVARVAASFITYSGVLTGFMALDRAAAPRFRWVCAAGAVTGMVSGLVRPEIRTEMVVAQAIAGAIFIAGVHWVALSHWRRVRARILSTTS